MGHPASPSGFTGSSAMVTDERRDTERKLRTIPPAKGRGKWEGKHPSRLRGIDLNFFEQTLQTARALAPIEILTREMGASGNVRHRSLPLNGDV